MRVAASRTLLAVTASLSLGLASLAEAACEYPAEVPIPDGKTATSEDISAANTAVKKYMADMDNYLNCLDAEEAALPEDQQTPEAKALLVKRHNAAVDAMEALANQFNTQLRAFKAAGGK